jgi:hypothetical protein
MNNEELGGAKMKVSEVVEILLKQDQTKEFRLIMNQDNRILHSNKIEVSNRIGFVALVGLDGN